MIFEDYEVFYENVIEEYISELVNYDLPFHALSVNHKAKRRIYSFYEKKRIDIRNNIMMDSEQPIDRHKTASTMMYAILRAKVFKIDFSIPNLPEPILIANQYLAFYVAMNIVELYKRHDDYIYNGIEDSSYLLNLPDTKYEMQLDQKGNIREHSFISSVCLTLAKIKKIRYYDVLSYATILFLLEERTDLILEYNQ